MVIARGYDTFSMKECFRHGSVGDQDGGLCYLVIDHEWNPDEPLPGFEVSAMPRSLDQSFSTTVFESRDERVPALDLGVVLTFFIIQHSLS